MKFIAPTERLSAGVNTLQLNPDTFSLKPINPKTSELALDINLNTNTDFELFLEISRIMRSKQNSQPSK